MGADDKRDQALPAGGRTSSPGAAERIPELAELAGRSRDRLLDAARDLGLTRVSKLKKHDLAVRILEALNAQARAAPAGLADARPVPLPPAPAPRPDAAPLEPRLEAAEAARREPVAPARTPPVEHIPWSYGLDRVTAAAVDPDRLFVWWEVTDPAIERARAALGPGAAGAWLALRVYDTTGRLFDGTNAHAYFDHALSRDDRQWFFTIGKPTSTAVVEVGMKSAEGYFVRIARSGRVDFPRKEPSPWTEPEWMTVLASGELRHSEGAGRRRHPAPAHPPGFDGGEPQHAPPATMPAWILREGGEAVFRRLLEEGWERVEWETLAGEGWTELARRFEWAGPAVVTSWEAGPFSYPVDIEPPRHEAWQGGALVYRVGGVTHVVSGPWQVVITNLGAFSTRSVVGRWEVYRWRIAESGHEVLTTGEVRSRPGASEQHLGASERRWVSGSELRLGGASEIFRLGASEVRFRGASERRYLGASEVRLRGASEQRLAGASEVRLRGASEQRLGGASEARLGGGSEARLGGASEQRPGGASEARLEPAAEPLPYPSVGGAPPAAAE
jgi:hypothetical protein